MIVEGISDDERSILLDLMAENGEINSDDRYLVEEILGHEVDFGGEY